jgi:hypothetical protein
MDNNFEEPLTSKKPQIQSKLKSENEKKFFEQNEMQRIKKRSVVKPSITRKFIHLYR